MITLLRPFFGYISLALAATCVVLMIGLSIERRHSSKLTERNTALAAKLEQITTAKNVQAKKSAVTVVEAVRYRDRVRTVVERIQSAPVNANCATPALATLREEL